MMSTHIDFQLLSFQARKCTSPTLPGPDGRLAPFKRRFEGVSAGCKLSMSDPSCEQKQPDRQCHFKAAFVVHTLQILPVGNHRVVLFASFVHVSDRFLVLLSIFVWQAR